MRALNRGGRVNTILTDATPGSVITTVEHSRGGATSRRNTGARGFRGRRATMGGVSYTRARPQTSNMEHWVVAFRGARRVFYDNNEVIIILLLLLLLLGSCCVSPLSRWGVPLLWSS